MSKEKKVYVLSLDSVVFEQHDTIEGITDDLFMDSAEEAGAVYSLEGFENAVNNDELYLDNCLIRIR